MIKFYGMSDPKVRWTQEAVDRLFGSCPRACLSGGGWGGCSSGPRGARGSRRHPPPSGSISCHRLASLVPSILSLPLAICPAHVCASLWAPPPSSPFPPLHFASSFPAFPILPLTPLSLTMDASHIPVCLHTDRTAPLKHPMYLAAVKRGEAHPAVTAFIAHEVLRMVATHVVKLVPPPNQANMFKAQRLLRTVREGCFSRPVFCITICELHFVPVGETDTEYRRLLRGVVAEFAGSVWDLMYRADSACKEHGGAAGADDDVRPQSHACFE